MSTIKVTNIQDTSGGNQSTSEEIFQGRAKVWVNFDGTFGTSPFTEANGGIRDSFNVTSVTDNGTGNYTVNTSITMPSVNYAAIATVGGGSISNASESTQIISRGTTGFQIYVASDGTGGSTYTVQNASYVAAAVFGD